jgi:SAM-dependent methyltransferase
MLQVVQTKQSSARRLFYLNDFLIQNTYDPETKQSTAMFTYMLHGLARAYTPQIHDVLCIGLGVGIVPMQFANEGSNVDVVEINPSVAPVGARYFDFRPSKVNLTIADGRYYVNKTKKKYDAIILDAFLGDSSPVHLFSREAFSSMRRVLKPGGTLVMNTFWSFEPNRDFFSASIEKTLKNVFASVRIHNGGNGNLFFVASDTPNLVIVHPPDFSQIHPSSVESVKEAFDGIRLMNPAHGRVLTDDYNPTEFYDAANREALRRQLALSMRASN